MKINPEALKNKLINNKIEEVLTELMTSSKDNSEKYNQIILVLSKYKELKNNIIIGIENSNSELQKVKYSIIKIIDELNESPASQSFKKKEATSKLEKIKTIFHITDTNAANLIFHLGESKYEWRKAKTLELKTGLSENELAGIARSYPDMVERGKSDVGEILYKLKTSFRSNYKSKI